jgi:arsenate reductase (glutaredoxin)
MQFAVADFCPATPRRGISFARYTTPSRSANRDRRGRERGGGYSPKGSDMSVTIYHNAMCGTSRGALGIIREKGIEPTVIEYLKTPLSKDQLKALIAKMGVAVKDVVRWKEKDAVAQAGISETSSDDALLEAMAKFPILMNRPIVMTSKGVKLCRPSDTVAGLL